MSKSEAQASQIDELQARLIAAEAKNVALAAIGSRRGGHVTKLDTQVTVLLRETVKDKVWRMIKFISSDKQMDQLAYVTLKKSGLAGKFDADGSLNEDGQHFIEENKVTINKIVNDHRSYCQTQMKEACLTWMKDNKATALPSNTEFLKILSRDPSVDKDLFAWWWSEYMPKAIGNSKFWNDKIKFFGHLSTHAPPEKPKEVYITPSTEAWGLLLIENCRERWPKLMAQKAESSAQIVYVKSSKTQVKPGTIAINVSDDPSYVGKYTKNDSGQKKFGGWSNEGLKRFAQLVKINKEGRAKATTAALEEEVLLTLRTKHGITGANWKEHKIGLKGTKSTVEVAEEIEGLIDMDEVGEMVEL